VLGRRLRLPPFSLFILASTLSEVLTLNHFFNVTDQGSWLEVRRVLDRSFDATLRTEQS